VCLLGQILPVDRWVEGHDQARGAFITPTQIIALTLLEPVVELTVYGAHS
jgi:hypothetical protein